VGDGKRSVLELVLAGTPPAKRASILTSAFECTDNADLDSIPAKGERRIVSWRHNLDSGAQPVLLEQGADRDACVEIARRAASAINIRFGSIDVVQVEGSWNILEINSGVMMEALSGSHPELVFAAYSAALDKVFGQTRV